MVEQRRQQPPWQQHTSVELASSYGPQNDGQLAMRMAMIQDSVMTSEELAVHCIFAAALEQHQAGRFPEAEALYRQVLRQQPANAEALHLLGLLNSQSGSTDIAVALIRKAIALKPDVPAFYNNLGNAFVAQGSPDKAVAAFEHALNLQPDNPRTHSSLFVTRHYMKCDRRVLLEESRAWGRRYAEPLASEIRAHPNGPEPERRLRIGYASGELFRHPVGYFLAPALVAHDRRKVEVFCYSNSHRSDALTAQLRASCDHWRSLVGVDDGGAAEMIRRDGIDILVDLSSHLGDHRLLVFARKPAPVQATWIGQINTSGAECMDYIIADHVVCPQGEDELYVEKVVRLPAFYMPFSPSPDAPDVAPLPALSHGHITFGCFNRIAKVTPQVIAVWSRILRALPSSRLRLISVGLNDSSVRFRFCDMFIRNGVDVNRIDLLGPCSHAELMTAYNDVDLALDPFPYSGCTSTAEALWMGVPVVSLKGDRFVSRTSASFLAAAGLEDLAAEGEDAYVSKAVTLASEVPRLAELRAELREAISRSAIGDGPRFTRQLERAYREMWRGWCHDQTRMHDGREPCQDE